MQDSMCVGGMLRPDIFSVERCCCLGSSADWVVLRPHLADKPGLATVCHGVECESGQGFERNPSTRQGTPGLDRLRPFSDRLFGHAILPPSLAPTHTALSLPLHPQGCSGDTTASCTATVQACHLLRRHRP